MAASQLKAAVLTPTGRGAVATVAVWGSHVAQVVDPFFLNTSGRLLSARPHGEIAFGRWGRSDGEDVVALRRHDGLIEIHCHGGLAASTAILSDLQSAGCIVVSGDEFLRAQGNDDFELAALDALQRATTLRTARILLDQYHGAFRRELDTIAACIASGDIDEAQSRLQQLLSRVEFGKHLTVPYRVVIAGPPNVGKSSLINALLGYERAIVFDRPGTTRDAITALTSFDGWPVELVDTAGCRTSDDPLEVIGVQLAQEQVSKADLVLWISDGETTAPLENSATNVIRVRNKCDSMGDRAQVCDDSALNVSALTGERLPHLIDMIAQRLVPTPPSPGDAVPFTPMHVAEIEKLLNYYAKT